MLINLSELFPVEGKSKTYTPELEMTQFGLADTVYDIAEKGPLSLVITNLRLRQYRSRTWRIQARSK